MSREEAVLCLGHDLEKDDGAVNYPDIAVETPVSCRVEPEDVDWFLGRDVE